MRRCLLLPVSLPHCLVSVLPADLTRVVSLNYGDTEALTAAFEPEPEEVNTLIARPGASAVCGREVVVIAAEVVA